MGAVPSEQPPFFVVGVDRSGTTMLRLVLDRGDVAIPPESMFLADFAHVRREGGLDRPEAADAFARRVWEHPRVRAWGLAGAAPQMPLGLTHEQAYRFAVESPFEAYARAHGRCAGRTRRRTTSGTWTSSPRSGPTHASSCSSATAAT
jgi:hypothetical protein